MKICLLTENYARGGLDTFINSLLNSWPDAQDIFEIYCNEEHPGLIMMESRLRGNLSVSRYKAFSTNHTNKTLLRFSTKQLNTSNRVYTSIYFIFESLFLFPLYVFKWRRVFKKLSFDRLLVVNGGYPGGLHCRAALVGWKFAGRMPLGILSFHNFAVKPTIFRGLFEKPIDFLVANSISRSVSVSKICLDSLENRDKFKNQLYREVIFNGIEDPQMYNKNYSKTHKNSLCIILGSYESRKGLDFALQAFKLVLSEVPTARLEVYGSGSAEYRKLLESLILKLGITEYVYLGGFLENPFKRLEEAMVLIVPSQSFESFGISIIEAMALGIPVVATNTGGIPEVIGNSNAGIICSKTDFREIAAAITKIAKDEDLAENMSKNARAWYLANFVSSTMSQKYMNLMK
jgi:glycosyltransferase involved in cell wall biosynthesis